MNEIENKNKDIKELPKEGYELFLNQPSMVWKKNDGHSTYFHSLEADFDSLFNNIHSNNDVRIDEINSLLHKVLKELLNHRIKITKELMPLFLELQKTIQDLMPMNQLVLGANNINQNFLEKNPVYLEWLERIKTAKKDNVNLTSAEVVMITKEAMSDYLYTKREILFSLKKLRQQDFLDEPWLYHTTIKLFNNLKELKLSLSKEFQNNLTKFELLKDYLSLLNIVKIDFSSVRCCFKEIAIQAGSFLEIYERKKSEYITLQLFPLLHCITEFWNITNSLYTSIDNSLTFAEIQEANKEYMNLLLFINQNLKDISNTTKDTNQTLHGVTDTRHYGLEDMLRVIPEAGTTKTVSRVKKAGFISDGMTTLEIRTGYGKYKDSLEKRGRKPEE